jgi:alpha-tubulin suppressor-like RCC1 family protein
LAFLAVNAGDERSCALLTGNAAYCWGEGPLGDGTIGDSGTPVRVLGGNPFERIDVSRHMCGLTTTGVALCWGRNLSGRLGDGSSQNRSEPTLVETSLRFTAITLGVAHTCALAEDSTAHCWGNNSYGQLGGLVALDSTVPVAVTGGLRFTALDGGGLSTCALDEAGAVYCWGDGWGPAPTSVAGSVPFVSISVGEDHACALTGVGEAFCWGENEEGQLGDGSMVRAESPTAVVTELRFSVITAGSRHTCGVADDDRVYCWGVDSAGQLGDGDPSEGTEVPRKLLPTRVRTPRSVRFVDVSAGNLLTCGLTNASVAYCWGFGTGSDTSPSSSSAVPVWF